MSDYDDYDDDCLDDFEREQRAIDNDDDEAFQQTAFAVYLNFEEMGWL